MASRRNVLRRIAGGAAVFSVGASLTNRIEAAAKVLGPKLNGKITHSVCRWCYKSIALDDLCIAAKKIGLQSIELLTPDEWPIVLRHGLTAAVVKGGDMGIARGFNDLRLHDTLVKNYEDVIPRAAAAGFRQIICFSGNRNGMDDEQGMENAAIGLKRLMPIAEKYKVTMVMELLNSKVNHKDYMADRTHWGASLVDKVGSDRFKLLYDIYHMQIMEGDVMATIRKYQNHISHYHTGGVPGRNEIDNTQELYYPAIMKAIADTGFKGFVAQEFIPKREDKLASLKQAVEICDIA